MAAMPVAMALFAAALLLATVAGASGSGTRQEQRLPKVVTIGVLNSLTGAASFAGVQELQAMVLAVKDAKRSRLLGKTEVRLKVVDDRSNAEAAVAGVHQLIDANVAAIAGPAVAGLATIASSISGQARVPQVLTTANATDVSPPYLFRAGIPQPRYASQVIKILAKRGVKRVAVFYDSAQPSIVDSVWNQTQKVALKVYKIDVAVTESAPVSTSGLSDFTSQVARLMQSKPDAIGVLLVGAPNLTVVNQLRQAGYKGIIWGQAGMDGPFFINGGPNVYGVLIPVSFAAGLGPKSSQLFAKRFEQRYGVVPTDQSARGYDAMWMILQALKKANSTDHKALQAALASIKTMNGAQGVVRFNAIGDALGSGFSAEVRNGKLIGVSK